MTAGPVNVRDLGGLPLVGGGRTIPGVLLRGDASYAGDPDPMVIAWPPAAVVDLRSAIETQRDPYEWPGDTAVTRHELYAAAALGSVPVTHGLSGVYEEILATASERVASVVGLLAPGGSTLVHCAAGKDRTGIVVAALLLVAGVEPAAVVKDYQLTEQSMPAVIGRLRDRTGLDLTAVALDWVGAPAEAVELVVSRLTGWLGGPRQWFLDHGADEAAVEAWVSRITGRVPYASG